MALTIKTSIGLRRKHSADLSTGKGRIRNKYFEPAFYKCAGRLTHTHAVFDEY